MSILRVAFDVETLCALPLEQRELDVVREEKELICARHGWREKMDWIGMGPPSTAAGKMRFVLFDG